MKKILASILLLLALYAGWIYWGRNPQWEQCDLSLDVMQSLPYDSGCERSIVGIQPFMLTDDYLTEEHFFQKMKGYFDAAAKAGYFKERTVVLLPEYLGTWLIIAGEKAAVAEAEGIQGAMTRLVLSNPLKFISTFSTHRGETDRFAATLFRMKAELMADIYSRTFTRLAIAYRVTISAGSIVLPGPSVTKNGIEVSLGEPLYNTAFIFLPDGSLYPKVVRKSFPIHSEMPFVAAAPITELPIFDLSIGKTAVLVCADSWYPESYVASEQQQAEVVLVPSFCSGDGLMSADWHGYDGRSTPIDVDTADIRSIKEKDAWVKYALPGRLKTTSATVGVNVFLRGRLWDLGSDGQPFFVNRTGLIQVQSADHAGIWSYCF